MLKGISGECIQDRTDQKSMNFNNISVKLTVVKTREGSA